MIQRKANAAPDVPAEARLPHFCIDGLRHTHATHLLREGWDIVTVSRRFGHASPAITLKIYAHALADTRGDDLATPAAFRPADADAAPPAARAGAD